MSGVVLDASAFVALLLQEQGWETVDALLDDAVISTVNMAEVVGLFARRGVAEADIRALLYEADIRRMPFDDELAYQAGLLAPLTRAAGLSLGDRACLALASRLGVPAVTTDRAWSRVAAQIGIQVQVVR